METFRASKLASLKPDSAGQWPDDHAVVVRTGHRVNKLHVKVPQDGAPDGLDLEVGKVGPKAAMPPAPKANEGKGPLLVFVPGGLKPVRLEAVGLVEQGWDLVLEARRRRCDVSLSSQPKLSQPDD